MSILIKGMEMPKSCADCELAEHYERYGNEHCCPFMGWYADYAKCPLVHVPPHGRLIDKDVMCNECRRIPEEYDGIYPDCTYCPAYLAPTIIPAEWRRNARFRIT